MASSGTKRSLDLVTGDDVLEHGEGSAHTLPGDAALPEGDNRPLVYTDPDGTIVYRGSGLGSCIKSLVNHRVADDFGFTPRPWSDAMLERFDEGRKLEPEIIQWLYDQGYLIFGSGHEQVEYDLPVLPGVVVRCHPDGIISKRGGPQHTTKRVLEVKALAESLAGKGLYALTHYPWQLSVEMAVTGLRALYVVHNKDSRANVIKEIDTLPKSLLQITARVAKVEALARASRAAGDILASCDQNDFPCLWYGISCDNTKQAKTTPDEPREQDDAITARVKAYHEAQLARREAEKVESRAKSDLWDVLGDRTRVGSGPYTVDVINVESQRLDTTKLKESEPDVYQRYLKPSSSKRIEVHDAFAEFQGKAS